MGNSTARSEPAQSKLDGEALAMLAQAVLGLRSSGDLGTTCAIAGNCATAALNAAEYRLLRVDSRSGALRLLEESGVETPYLAEPGGPVEWLLRQEAACFDDGADGARFRETLLWRNPPRALAALPLFSRSTLFGCLLLGFAAPLTLSSDQRLFLKTLADALALALERAELHRMLDEERMARCELERRLDSEEESSSSLMSVVAHEIRTPLAAIKAYTETLLGTLDNPHTPRQRFLSIIDGECERLGRLVADILDLSRIDAGQRPLRLERLNLTTLLEEVIGGLGSLRAPRQVEVELEVEHGLVVEADPKLVRRLFVNLVGNAIRFSPVGGRVQVRAVLEGEHWSAAVEDHGTALPLEDLPRIFERFLRGGTPGDQQLEGTGLGLAIARGVVELHGGRLWVESPAGGGTRFCLSMPASQMASPEARRIARHVTSRPDLRELFQSTVEMVAAAMDAEIVSLMLVDPDRGDLFVAASRGLEGQNLAERRTPVRSGVAGAVAAWGRPVLVSNIETDRRFLRLNHPQYTTKSLLSVPLVVEREVLGVVNVNNKTTRMPFNDDDLGLLVTLIDRVGSAVERAYLYPDSGQTVEEAAEAIRSVTRLRGEGLLGNRRRAGRARALARALELSPADVDVIGYVATIHDLGMTPIQRRLDSIPGPLEQNERAALIKHPEATFEMIRPIEYLGLVRDLILSHHEHWDGNGYPRGLKGEAIPLGGRILAVVDAFESMTGERPFRPARDRAEALAELRREAGRQFDPVVVEAFARLLDQERAPQ